MPYTIIAAGASGSGKSTIVSIIVDALRVVGFKVGVLAIDYFYFSMEPGKPKNWDTPAAIDMDLLCKVLKQLQAGEIVKVPGYDYVTHQRIDNKYEMGNEDVLIVEGIFGLHDQRICDAADLKLFIDADPIYYCLPRRFERDTRERGRDGLGVVNQYTSDVLKGFTQFVLPSRSNADLIIPNERDHPSSEQVAIKAVIACVKDNIGK